jgi:N6-L-threonylcarbamoyladenine synthase
VILSLGVETSCDECSASWVSFDGGQLKVLGLATYTQLEEHRPYGGVVPEIASRNHLEQLPIVLEEASKQAGLSFSQADVVSVTNRPGLVGALLVGLSGSKALAYAIKRPLVPVHHLEGHLISPWLDAGDEWQKAEFPAIVLLASGGHTQLHVVSGPPMSWPKNIIQESFLGSSRDDAAGEAFDKSAKLMGLPYPGGVELDRRARSGNSKAFQLPRPMMHSKTNEFSFSGLKTAVALQVAALKKSGDLDTRLSDLAASVEAAIVDVLISKMEFAIQEQNAKAVIVVGGVSANTLLRARASTELSVPLISPKLKYCTDNAAMIAAVGALRHAKGESVRDFYAINAYSQANA